MIKAAFHIHTMQIPPAEGAQTTSVERLLSQLYAMDVRLPIITNKNSISDVIKARPIAEKLGMHVPYAVEARTRPDRKENPLEIIAIFEELDSTIEHVMKHANFYEYDEFVECVKKNGGKIVLPHPYLKRNGIAHLRGESAVEELCRRDLVDGIEWNLQIDKLNFLMGYKNERAEILLESINKRYGLKLPFIPGNDSYFGDVGVVMNVESDDSKDALEKIFEGRFYTERVKSQMPVPFYLLKHLEFAMLYEPRGTLGIFF